MLLYFGKFKLFCIFYVLYCAYLYYRENGSNLASDGDLMKNILKLRNNELSENVGNLFDVFSKPICYGSIFMLRNLWKYRLTHQMTIRLLYFKCREHNIMSQLVCHSMLEKMLPQFDTMVRTIFTNRTRLCSRNFALFQNWTIPIPDEKTSLTTPPKWPENDVPVIKILQITDIHLDLNYRPNSPIMCQEQFCCWTNSTPTSNMGPRSGNYSEYNCDSSLELVETVFEYIKHNLDVDYIYLTGDYVAHDDFISSVESKTKVIKLVFSLVKLYFPSIKIFPVIGNHEGYPVNSFPSPLYLNNRNGQWLYDLMAELSLDWLDEEALETFRLGGFYTVLLRKGLRLIVLNSNFCESTNFWMTIDNYDPFDQLSWMIDILLKSESINEKVHLTLHHPTGDSDSNYVWPRNLNNVVDRFKHTIVAMFCGHRHNQYYKIFFDSKTAKIPQNILYSGASLSSFHSGIPTITIYKIDGSEDSDFVVTDIEIRSLDINNIKKDQKPDWLITPSIKKTYHLKNLSPVNWYNFSKSLNKVDSNYRLFMKYYKNQADLKHHHFHKKDVICSLFTTVTNDKRVCKRLKLA